VRIDEVAWDHPASVSLRQAQRDEIAIRYGTPDSEPGPAPTADDIVAFYVAFADDGAPLGCGGLRRVNDSEGEVKRMFVTPSSRGTGTSSAILEHLEASARDRGWIRLLLETGDQQPDAVRFYTREGYERVPNFGYYVGVAESRCFAKEL
jgi:GNAT superfamily N-acetyltransferase